MNETLKRIYAGFLGMNIGIRLGAPVEPAPWDFAMIERYYGDIRGYVKRYRNFAADDDVNGPVYFLRSLLDNGVHEPLTSQAVAESWLNYARDGIGMFWWGGDGVSCEHTSYCNLKRGIPAPQSGSIAQNGVVMAEQIGGQIFIDTWGLICPGDPRRAAELASIAASVSHDGNGIYGGAFIAACIAAAFTTETVDKILDAGLAEIPGECTYARVVQAVRTFHQEHPEDFRLCMRYLIDHWGYDRYPGACHIIPNAGVCVLALLYGGGDFARTVEIATMCGWDTDCNAGSVGTIAGVFCGLEDIPAHYRAPIGDFIVLSGISGYLNNLDAATYAKFLYQLSRVHRGLPRDPQVTLPRGGEQLFDFRLPGSTHGLRLSSETRFMWHSGEEGLELIIDRVLPADHCDVYYKPFYRRSDFDDERYKPVFSPTVYSGQTLRCRFTPHFFIPGRIFVRPYVRTAMRDERYDGGAVLLEEGKPVELVFRLPDTGGDYISEVGFHIEAAPETESRVFARLKMESFAVTGKGDYRISTALCAEEFLQQTPFSQNHGRWYTEGGCLLCETEEPAQAYTGNYYAADVVITSDVAAETGSCLMARAAGARRYLAAGFLSEGKLGLRLHDTGRTEEFPADFPWQRGRDYRLTLEVLGDTARLLADGQEVLCRTLSLPPNGMVGFAQECAGAGRFRDLAVQESGSYPDLIPESSSCSRGDAAENINQHIMLGGTKQ